MWQGAKNLYHLFVALVAQVYYGFPARKLTVIGVTGTSGKTTTTHMIYEMLKANGFKVSMVSSIQAILGGKSLDTGFHITTPDPHKLPQYLRQAVDAGDKYFVLEVSSHGLDQNRAAFVPFFIGVLTSLAHEHLDYHKTFVNYARAKFKLLHQSKHAVLPYGSVNEQTQKDVHYEGLASRVKTFGIDEGEETQKEWKLKLKMPGDYNILDALAAATVGTIVGIEKKGIVKALESFVGLLGRYEEIPTKKDFRVVIDFAHKPDALQAVLETARKQMKGKGRLIVLYGCASQRDLQKRGMMGEISGRLADVTVITDEDPRFEEPMKIINEIATGCARAGAREINDLGLTIKDSKERVFYKIPDRKEAIKFAIQKLANKGDLLLFCGKGHEASMNYNGVERPWSEHAAAAEALRNLK